MSYQRPDRSRPPAEPPQYIIIARGEEVHSFILRKWMIGLAVLLCAGVTFWLCAATAYIVFRDDVLAGMVARNTRLQHAYEDRIAAMRLQIDRISSRQLVDQDALTTRMSDILRRQGQIEQRTHSLGNMLDKARQSGILPRDKGDDTLKTGSITPPAAKTAMRHSADYSAALGKVEYTLARLTITQDRWLSETESKLQDSESRLRSAISELGLSPEKYGVKRLIRRPPVAASAAGGPLIPLYADGTASDPFIWRAENLQNSFEVVNQLQRAVRTIPLRKPVAGALDLSSGFGSRSDPFLGVLAFHAGLDFRAEQGEPIRATAAGKVETAGRDGGYGLMVEIDHGQGVSTRYGHMSKILVKAGDTIVPGAVIGLVGSTGRSTGPHLHYETRINDEPVNPDKFLRAGIKLKL
ncbi:M23 family metallopeptidase [Candidatus Raskinella chloraquaticus]